MKKHLSYLIPIAIINSLVVLSVLYFFAFRLSGAPIGIAQIIYMALLPGLLFFLILLILGFFLFKNYYIYCSREGLIALKRLKLSMTTMALTIAAVLVVDSLYTLFDDTLAASIGSKIDTYFETVGQQSTDEKTFSHLPLFVQNIFPNIFFIFIAILLSSRRSKNGLAKLMQK